MQDSNYLINTHIMRCYRLWLCLVHFVVWRFDNGRHCQELKIINIQDPSLDESSKQLRNGLIISSKPRILFRKVHDCVHFDYAHLC